MGRFAFIKALFGNTPDRSVSFDSVTQEAMTPGVYQPSMAMQAEVEQLVELQGQQKEALAELKDEIRGLSQDLDECLEALHEILAMETPNANHTVKKMVKVASTTLARLGVPPDDI